MNFTGNGKEPVTIEHTKHINLSIIRLMRHMDDDNIIKNMLYLIVFQELLVHEHLL